MAAQYNRPQKDKGIALILEILPGFFGLLGFGWIYAGATNTGILWLTGMIVWDVIAITIIVLSAGFGCFCTFPVNLALIAISSMMLSNYTKQHPDVFPQ